MNGLQLYQVPLSIFQSHSKTNYVSLFIEVEHLLGNRGCV